MGELIVGVAVVLDRLTVHEPQLDVAKAAAPERFIGFLDRQRYEIGGVTDVIFGRIAAEQHHDVDHNVLGLQCLTLCIGKRRHGRLGRRRARRRRLIGARHRDTVAHCHGRVVSRQLVAVHIREGVHSTAQALDGVNRALVGEISRQQRVAPQHQQRTLARLLHLADPGNAAVLLERGSRSHEGEELAVAERQLDLRSNGVVRSACELKHSPHAPAWRSVR